jgi:hypothetical protein
MVNNNPNRLNNKTSLGYRKLARGWADFGGRSGSWKRRLREHAVLLGKVPGRRSDDCPFADYNFAPLADSLPDVVLAYELRRFFGSRGRGKTGGWLDGRGRLDRRRHPLRRHRCRRGITAGSQKLVDAARERFRGNARLARSSRCLG